MRPQNRVPHISLLRCGLLLTLAFAPTLKAQWQILPTPTTANLRGIQALPNGIAWASGTEGTVLRTTDEGKTWQRCTTPPAADKLDFRGIQAFDANTAIVMSSGKGDLSRLYKPTDSCKTWTLLFTNPDPEGFWDALSFLAAERLHPEPLWGVDSGRSRESARSHFGTDRCHMTPETSWERADRNQGSP